MVNKDYHNKLLSEILVNKSLTNQRVGILAQLAEHKLELVNMLSDVCRLSGR